MTLFFQQLWRLCCALLLISIHVFPSSAFADAVISESNAAKAALDLGNSAYAEGNFDQAKQHYERFLAIVPRPNVFFNLGNAHFRLEDLGAAALAYERCLALEPQHAAAKANLSLLREKTGARSLNSPWYAQLIGRWRFSYACWTALGLSWLGFFLLGRALWKRTGAFPVFVATVVIVAGLGFAAAQIWRSHREQHLAVVTPAKCEAHNDPSDRSGTADSLAAGSTVRIEAERGAWSYCALPNGRYGWIKAVEIVRVVPAKKS